MYIQKIILFVLFIDICFCEIRRYYVEKKFKVPVDHFSFARSEEFHIRYLINDTYWDKNSGPIFFYTGNEGEIESFSNYTGFMWSIAKEFDALVVFAEHRYYGNSLPFGENSYKPEYLGYLTSSQALADYAELITFLQGNSNTPKYPVIAFGGSYGGMLAAYIRMKYPHLVTGSIAASAPIHQFTGMVSCDAFNRIVTSNFKLGGNHCAENIKQSWSVIRNITTTAAGKVWLSNNWKLCNPVKNETDAENLINYLKSVYTALAMVNYPFESAFLQELPAYPVKFVCQYLNETLSGDGLLKGIGLVVETYANYTGQSKCININDVYGNLNGSGWDYQACTEMIIPECATGIDDMFEKSPWNFTEFSNQCFKKFKVLARPFLARINYGGNYIRAASNIVFSNGLLDPWASGGILDSLSGSLISVIITDGAHHLDLMEPHENDPYTVQAARAVHKENIRKWINEFYSLQHKGPS